MRRATDNTPLPSARRESSATPAKEASEAARSLNSRYPAALLPCKQVPEEPASPVTGQAVPGHSLQACSPVMWACLVLLMHP